MSVISIIKGVLMCYGALWTVLTIYLIIDSIVDSCKERAKRKKRVEEVAKYCAQRGIPVRIMMNAIEFIDAGYPYSRIMAYLEGEMKWIKLSSEETQTETQE